MTERKARATARTIATADLGWVGLGGDILRLRDGLGLGSGTKRWIDPYSFGISKNWAVET